MTATTTFVSKRQGETTSSGLPAASAERRRGRRADLRNATDDEILGIGAATEPPAEAEDLLNQAAEGFGGEARDGASSDREPEPDAQAQASGKLHEALAAHPELRKAWQDAGEYRKTFPNPERAKRAAAELSELEQLDALFFSKRAEDHAELARVVASLDPQSFARFAQAIQSHFRQPGVMNPAAPHKPFDAAARSQPEPIALPDTSSQVTEHGDAGGPSAGAPVFGDAASSRPETGGKAQLTPQETQFLHAANAEAVHNVVEAVETQLEHLLPEGISKGARSRIIGDIYRELQASLQSNRQLGQQLREAFRGGAMDAAHQRAMVSLLTARAKQALPGVAKHVLSEWTATLVASHRGGRDRQRAAETRVDIAGTSSTGGKGRRPVTPRDIDYSRTSDAEILNL